MVDTESVNCVCPVGVGLAVPYAVCNEVLLGLYIAGLGHPVDVLSRVHNLCTVSETVHIYLILEEYVSVSSLCSALCGHEDNTVTSLRSVDGG